MTNPQKLYAPYDKLNPSVVATMKGALEAVGISCTSEHSWLTAHRLTHYLQYLLVGAEEPHYTVFENKDPVVSHMVVVPNIPFWSACSHHCLPFIGEVSVGYIPNKLLIGLSKIPLIVRYHARGLWLQEHLANSIADHLEELLQPMGVAVYIQAQHTCQLLDLEQPPIPVMKTTVLRGVLMHGQAARSEFYQMIRKKG
jgi:GTP cyclohydrolase I